MKILIIADEEEKILYDFFDKELVKGVDLIISCGDLKRYYLEYLETMINCPLIYVPGNHDDYAQNPPQGCIDIDDKIYDFRGLRILGLGGSMRYNDKPNMYTEEEMEKRIRRMKRSIVLHNGFDVLVTHAPARGYGDLEDLPHLGFSCFNDLLNTWKPKYMLHGHVHKEYGGFKRSYDHPSGTRIYNGYGHMILEIGDHEHPAKGKTGSALYDLYVSIQSRGKHNA